MVYLISDGFCSDYYLIDIGDFEAAMHLLPTNADVKAVFITHGHHDHIFGLNQLKETFPDCKVYASDESKIMLASAKANLSYYLEIPFSYNGDVTILNDGDTVNLFDDVWLTAIAAPGHHPSCLCFQVGDFLFTGDSYIPGVNVVTNLPRGNKEMAQESSVRIKELGKNKVICPGHNLENTSNSVL